MAETKTENLDDLVEVYEPPPEEEKPPEPKTLAYVAGVDLGKENDYTALVLMRVRRTEPMAKRYYEVVHGQRWRLQTPYTKIAEDLDRMLRSPRLTAGCALVLDETGVGGAVADIVRQYRSCAGVTIHGGYRVARDPDPERERYRVPKGDLIGVAVRVLQEKRIAIAQLPDLPEFERELREFTRRPNPRGADEYGPLVQREGNHDDYVFGLGIALWYVEEWCGPGKLADEDAVYSLEEWAE